jgi:hypothetical protein
MHADPLQTFLALIWLNAAATLLHYCTAPQQKQEYIVIDGLFVMGYGGQKTWIIQQVTGRDGGRINYHLV